MFGSMGSDPRSKSIGMQPMNNPTLAHPPANNPLTAALGYAARGWPVLPLHWPLGQGCSCGRRNCGNVGKHPLTEHGLHDGSLEPAEIRGWWTKWPDANIGIVTGQLSRLLVVDVDPRHGGLESLPRLESIIGPLPVSYTVTTGGGGTHYYFALPPGVAVPSSNGKIAPGIDIKADGGYIVAPPSLHKSGRCYERVEAAS